MHALLASCLWGSIGAVAWMACDHYQRQAVLNFSRFEGVPIQVRLDRNAYHYMANWGQGRVPWDQIQSLWRLRHVWVLLQHVQGGVSILLPAESLDDEARGFLVQQVLASGGELHS
jgi:hypothetical protein